jgi:hypothetical protein
MGRVVSGISYERMLISVRFDVEPALRFAASVRDGLFRVSQISFLPRWIAEYAGPSTVA